MNVKDILRRLIPKRWQRRSSGDPISMVLLLRKPHFFEVQELRLAAEKAWGTSFAGGKGSKHCVFQSGIVTLMKEW